VRLDDVSDKNFAYWHSATFNNDGTKVIFTDEWGGGTRPRCRATDPLTGAPTPSSISSTRAALRRVLQDAGGAERHGELRRARTRADSGAGRDIMAQAWYQGGVSVFDFTDSAHPMEIAFFDRGPIDAKQLVTGGLLVDVLVQRVHLRHRDRAWRDVFRLCRASTLTQNEIDAALMIRSEEFNAQEQTRIVWPAATVVARAYLDQLTRNRSIQPIVPAP